MLSKWSGTLPPYVWRAWKCDGELQRLGGCGGCWSQETFSSPCFTAPPSFPSTLCFPLASFYTFGHLWRTWGFICRVSLTAVRVAKQCRSAWWGYKYCEEGLKWGWNNNRHITETSGNAHWNERDQFCSFVLPHKETRCCCADGPYVRQGFPVG